VPALPEFLVAAAIFADIRTGKVDDRIKQRYRFGQNRSDFLPALPRHLAQAGIGFSVDLKRSADQIHPRNLSHISPWEQSATGAAAYSAAGCTMLGGGGL
jgi:hypothetical protein